MELKSLNQLDILELEFKRYNSLLGVKENDLEEYLIKNDYNVYSSNPITKREVVEEDFTTDSDLLINFMLDLGFESKEMEDETYLFYIDDEEFARYIEIIQEVCGTREGLDYNIYDSEDGELFSNIKIYDTKNNKEYKLIYSFENDDYVLIKDNRNIKLTYTDEMKSQDLLWETQDEDTLVMENLFKQIISEAKGYGCSAYFNIYQGPEECICDVYESEEEYESYDENLPVEFSYGCCKGLIDCIEILMNNK